MKTNTFPFLSYEQAIQFCEEGRNYVFQYDCDMQTMIYLLEQYEVKRAFYKNVYSKRFVDKYVVPWFPYDNFDHRMDLCDVYQRNTLNAQYGKNFYYTLDRVKQLIDYMDKHWLLSLELDEETKLYIQEHLTVEDNERYILP